MQMLCPAFAGFPFMIFKLKYSIMIIITISIKLHIVLPLQYTKVVFADSHQTSDLYHVRKGANMKQKG